MISPEQIAAIALSVLALGAGGVGAVQVAENPFQSAPPEWADNGEGEITISVDGPVEPGETVTLAATYQGEPVPHAPVEVNGEEVGETDESGLLEVEVPVEDEFEVEIEPDFEGEREIPLAAEDESDERDEAQDYEVEDRQIELNTIGNVSVNESVTVSATVNETPLYGAEISVKGDLVGTTDANGTLEVVVPAERDEFELEAAYDYAGEYEVEFADVTDEAMNEEPVTGPIALAVDGTFAGGETVTITATSNGTAVENATVSVNDERVGQTSADGEITVTIPENIDEVEIEIESAYGEAELAYEFEHDESDSEAADDERDEEEDDSEGEDDDEDESEDGEDDGDEAETDE